MNMWWRDALGVFGAILASMPFFFGILRIVMRNLMAAEREELRKLFVSKELYDAKHSGLEKLVTQSITTSEKNGAYLQSLLISLLGERATPIVNFGGTQRSEP